MALRLATFELLNKLKLCLNSHSQSNWQASLLSKEITHLIAAFRCNRQQVFSPQSTRRRAATFSRHLEKYQFRLTKDLRPGWQITVNYQRYRRYRFVCLQIRSLIIMMTWCLQLSGMRREKTLIIMESRRYSISSKNKNHLLHRIIIHQKLKQACSWRPTQLINLWQISVGLLAVAPYFRRSSTICRLETENSKHHILVTYPWNFRRVTPNNLAIKALTITFLQFMDCESVRPIAIKILKKLRSRGKASQTRAVSCRRYKSIRVRIICSRSHC